MAALALLAAGCSENPNEGVQIGVIQGPTGAVAADEPRAAVIGREVLDQGGAAGDAAAAMFFALTATLPSRVSLASGGVCISFSHRDLTANVITFLPQSGAIGGTLPTAPRAISALHARHGDLRWGAVLAPAENLARFGFEVSRAFAQDIQDGRVTVARDPEMRKVFQKPNGALVGEGDRLVQLDLATVLSGLRSRGIGYFYSGDFARRYVAASSAAGQPITFGELADAVPEAQQPAMVRVGRRELFFNPPPADDGLLAAVLWELLNEVEDYEDEDEDLRAHLFVEAAMRAFADRDRWLEDGEAGIDLVQILDEDRLELLMAGYTPERHTPTGALADPPRELAESPYGAGFVVGDAFGTAIACSFTMNGLFGAGRMAPGTGIVLSAPPDPEHNGGWSPSVAVYGNIESGEGYLAAAASGGAAAPTALVQVLLGLLLDEVSPKDAIGAPRLHHGGAPDLVLYEPEVPPAVLSALKARGHQLEPRDSLGRVSAFYCPRGLPDNDHGCRVASDPRGHGMGALGQ